jgi:hypothetical protein
MTSRACEPDARSRFGASVKSHTEGFAGAGISFTGHTRRPERTGSFVVALAVLVAVVILGCDAREGRAAAPRETQTGAAPDPGLRAMLSVHAHALLHEPFDVEGVPSIMPLEEAAKVLTTSTSAEGARNPRAASRVRRAIARTAAYGWDEARGDFRQPQKAALATLLSALPPPGLTVEDMAKIMKQRRASPSGTCQELSPMQLESEMMDLKELRSMTSDCDYKEMYQFVSPLTDPLPGEIHFMASVKVPRAVQEARKAMDPQNWDACSGFWCPNGTCFVADTPPMDGDKCAVSGGTPNEIPGEPIGGVYTSKLLFERFTCHAPECDAQFCNTLLVTAAETTPPSNGRLDGHCIKDVLPLPSGWPLPTAPSTAAKSYRIDYFLQTPLGGQVLQGAQKVSTDFGCAQVDDQGNIGGTPWSLVFGHKVLALENKWTEAIFHALLLGFAELGGSQVELACCLPPACGAPSELPCK